MDQPKSNRFTKYFPLLLDALRSADPTPMRPAEARAWIRARIEVPTDDLTRLIKSEKQSGKQSIFENDVHWARFYLAKAGLLSKAKRGLWGLTPDGRDTRLTGRRAGSGKQGRQHQHLLLHLPENKETGITGPEVSVKLPLLY